MADEISALSLESEKNINGKVEELQSKRKNSKVLASSVDRKINSS